MKVIDNTPFLEEKGSSGPWKRIQGPPESGPAWHAELEAQPPVIAQMAGVLDEGYTLIRNLPLGHKKIIEPLVLVGPPGVFVLYVSPVAPFLDVREGQSSAIQDSRSTLASANLVARVAGLAHALQVHLNRRGVILPNAVEPVLIAASPAVHIEVRRRSVRVVLSDGVKEFAASLLQEQPRLSSDEILEILDHLTNPLIQAVAVGPQPIQGLSAMAPANTQEAAGRARAIFRAAGEAKPFDLDTLKSELDGQDSSAVPFELTQKSPPPRLASVKRRKGFSSGQWFLLVAMLLVELVVLSAFAFLVFFGT